MSDDHTTTHGRAERIAVACLIGAPGLAIILWFILGALT